MKHTTSWNTGISFEHSQSELPANHGEIDVLIIGGGMAGTLAAYTASNVGKKVIVIEKQKPEYSVTAHTTAFLTHIVDTRLDQLIHMFGEERAREVWKSHAWAIDEIEKSVLKNTLLVNLNDVQDMYLHQKKNSGRKLNKKLTLVYVWDLKLHM